MTEKTTKTKRGYKLVNKTTCRIYKHPNKEYFWSLENKDRILIRCVNCNTHLGIVTIFDNSNKFDGD